MNITLQINDSCVTASVPFQSLPGDLNRWMDFILEVLRFSSEKKRIYLFTLSPQNYSLGYELGSFEESKVHKEKVLINYFEKATDNLLLEIVNSEEFARGLIKVILTDEKKIFDDLNFVTSDYSHLKDELITMEDDGASFYWYNPSLSQDQIKDKLGKLYHSFGSIN